MKSKGIVLTLIMVSAVIIASLGRGNAMNAEYQYEDKADRINAMVEVPFTIESETIHFDAGMVKVISFEIAKNYDKIFKYKICQKENDQIRRSVEGYILYSNTSPHHCPGLYKLRRLNT